MIFSNEQFSSLIELTVQKYLKEGKFVSGFVRGKLMHDPVYRSIVQQTLLPNTGTIVDIGCGKGILLALLITIKRSMPGITNNDSLHGIELREKDAKIASNILGGEAQIIQADIRKQNIPACQVVILLDVLMYLSHKDQETLLREVSQALAANGLVIIREADACAGIAFKITRWAERCCALFRGNWRQRCYYRSQHDWMCLLVSMGFNVEVFPMSQGTPFANFLFVAKLAS